jgi:hypothetical protein
LFTFPLLIIFYNACFVAEGGTIVFAFLNGLKTYDYENDSFFDSDSIDNWVGTRSVRL